METVNAVGHDSRGGAPVDAIILHGTNAGTNQTGRDIVNYWNNNNQLSAHYIVAADGTITNAVPHDRAARHTGYDGGANGDHLENDNARSIGIEVVSPLDGKTPPTAKQTEALAALVRWIQSTEGIPTDMVMTHGHAGDARDASSGSRDRFGEDGTFDVAAFKQGLL